MLDLSIVARRDSSATVAAGLRWRGWSGKCVAPTPTPKSLWLRSRRNSGHHCSPNATYDRIVGITPCKCSRRDTTWCQGDQPQQPDEEIIALTRQLAENGGVVTFDVPIQKSGLIPQPFVRQLPAIGRAMAKPAKP